MKHPYTHHTSLDLVGTSDLVTNNSMCGNGTSFQAAKDGTLRDVQNPIYGDDMYDGSASGPHDQLYAIAKPSQALLVLGTEEQCRYDYAANGTPPEYAVVETKTEIELR